MDPSKDKNETTTKLKKRKIILTQVGFDPLQLQRHRVAVNRTTCKLLYHLVCLTSGHSG